MPRGRAPPSSTVGGSKACSIWPVRESRIESVPSIKAVASCRPSGLKAARTTVVVCCMGGGLP